MEKPKICRLISLAGFNGVLLGRDLADVFKPGHVYGIVDVMGTKVIRDLGKHAQPEWLTRDGEPLGTIRQYAMSGAVYLTQAEYDHEKKIKADEFNPGGEEIMEYK